MCASRWSDFDAWRWNSYERGELRLEWCDSCDAAAAVESAAHLLAKCVLTPQKNGNIDMSMKSVTDV